MENLENSNIEKDTRIGNLENSNIEKDTRIGNLEKHVNNLYDELEPLRSRQLIEAGRIFFWNKSKLEYKSKYPKMVVHKSQELAGNALSRPLRRDKIHADPGLLRPFPPFRHSRI